MSRISYIDNLNEWEQTFNFFHTLTVRFSEIDMFGHLNNTVPITYFEIARIEYFNHLKLMQNWVNEINEEMIVVADVQCDYIKQVFYNEILTIHVKAAKVGNSSVDLHYMGKRENGEIVFTGRGTVVQISRKTGKSIPWSEEVKDLYQNRISVESK